MSGLNLKFTEPPQQPRIGKWSYDWTAVVKQLKERPGEWALLDKGARISVANALREGKILNIRPEDGFQITQSNTNRKVNPGTCDIYLRYWPENDTNLTKAQRSTLMKQIKQAEQDRITNTKEN